MVSLKWGDVLSHLLPGAVGLYASAKFFPELARLLANPNAIGPAAGIALLMAAALIGGILEAFTRLTWERFVLQRFCRSRDVLKQLTKDNLELYERGVQSSYKYVTFYANFAWATLFLFLCRIGVGSVAGSLLLLSATIVLLLASYVQWTYYVNYQNKVFGPRSDDAAQRSPAGDGSQSASNGPKGETGPSAPEVRRGAA